MRIDHSTHDLDFAHRYNTEFIIRGTSQKKLQRDRTCFNNTLLGGYVSKNNL
jgi:hypothetical protein